MLILYCFTCLERILRGDMLLLSCCLQTLFLRLCLSLVVCTGTLHILCSTLIICAVRRIVRLGILLDIGGPVNAISHGFSTAEENWERPEPLICAKYLLKIQSLPHIVWASERFSLLIQVFNCRFVCCCKENVESQEHCQENCYNTSEYVADLND